VSTERTLHNQPDSNEIWAGIGGHFDSLGQIIAEFVDNSIANIMATDPVTRDVSVRLIDLQSAVRVQIEDTGTGIDNLDNAFTLGGKEGRLGPLN
jgi:signal transduction histidine kinase